MLLTGAGLTPLPAQENAAPSIHLSYYFASSDATLKMQKIKIVQSAYASYFEVNWFTNGYTGLQQTPDTRYGKPNILISSLWDASTAGGIFSTVDYNHPQTIKSRFGGEGDGWKTIHPYDWNLDRWYNLVNRAWRLNGRLYIGTFINDLSTGKWFHTATLSIPFPQKYLNSYNDAFLENWDGRNAAWNGSFIRKAFFKDCWNLTTTGSWQKNMRAYFSANDSEGDRNRNGIYHNSFNGWYDEEENAYLGRDWSTSFGGDWSTYPFLPRTASKVWEMEQTKWECSYLTSQIHQSKRIFRLTLFPSTTASSI